MKPDALTLVTHQYSESAFTNLSDCIDSARKYFENNFVFNLEKQSSVRSHCMDWLTADPQKRQLQNECIGIYNDTCQHCLLVPKVAMAMNAICSNIEKDPKGVNPMKIQNWRYKLNKAELSILEYRNHLLRNKASNLDWENYLSIESPDTAVVTHDFAMNHLPQKFR